MLRYVGFNGNGMGSSSCLESYIGRVFMKYISEEKIIELITELTRLKHPDMGDIAMHLRDHSIDTLKMVISECRELNQWQTIESAPKDREILVYAPAYQDLRFLISVCKWHESAGFCIDELRQPTHWMELPKPPRED